MQAAVYLSFLLGVMFAVVTLGACYVAGTQENPNV